ncbi:MAG: hypothetical protein IJU71_11890 [Selenomonadaceae bacterium]|nr:hypothetical protein [Selenomonadaceae bacterium]
MRSSKLWLTKPKRKREGIPDNLKNCKVCGKVFIVRGDESLCRECLKKEEAERNRVMDYVRDNPGVTIEQALAATGVPDRMLKRMVLEGMFSNDKDRVVTQAGRVCAICGAPVGGTGIYCRTCALKMQRETKQLVEQTVDKHVDKKIGDMNIIDRLNAQAAREFELEQNATRLRR